MRKNLKKRFYGSLMTSFSANIVESSRLRLSRCEGTVDVIPTTINQLQTNVLKCIDRFKDDLKIKSTYMKTLIDNMAKALEEVFKFLKSHHDIQIVKI